MVKFIDGPAEGKELRLMRTPMLLRVVIGPRGKTDALDLPCDVAESGETIFVYRILGKPTHMHIRAGKGAGGGFYAIAHYGLFDEVVPDEIARDNDRWEKWCHENRTRIMARLKPEIEKYQSDLAGLHPIAIDEKI